MTPRLLPYPMLPTNHPLAHLLAWALAAAAPGCAITADEVNEEGVGGGKGDCSTCAPGTGVWARTYPANALWAGNWSGLPSSGTQLQVSPAGNIFVSGTAASNTGSAVISMPGVGSLGTDGTEVVWSKPFAIGSVGWSGGEVRSLVFDPASDRLIAGATVAGSSIPPRVLAYSATGDVIASQEGARLAAAAPMGGLISIARANSQDVVTRRSASNVIEWSTPVRGDSLGLTSLSDGSSLVVGVTMMNLPDAGYGPVTELTRLDANGTELWQQRYRGAISDKQASLYCSDHSVSSTGEIFLACHARLGLVEHGELIKLDPEGIEQWRFSVPDSHGVSRLRGIAATPEGGVVAVGTLHLDTTKPSIYYAALDADGTMQWVIDRYDPRSYGADIVVHEEFVYAIGSYDAKMLVTKHYR